MSEKEAVREAAAYFRTQPGLARLLARCLEKYRSLGRLSGKVTLEKPSETERQAVEALLRRRCDHEGRLSVSLKELQQALRETRFAEADLLAVLQAYAREEVLPKSQERRRKQEERDFFFQELLRGNKAPLSQRWLQAVWEKEPGTQRAQRLYASSGEARRLFSLLALALAKLPAVKERLPLFAARLTGDPHAFDLGTNLGRVFLEALRFLRRQAATEAFSQTEEDAEVLYQFRLLRDDVLNFVTCAGLTAWRQREECLEEVGYWRAAWRQGAILNAPLRELAILEQLRSASEGQAAYIVENSGVFSAILDEFAQRQLPLPPLLCTHGNFKLASWVAVELLQAGGCTIYYSGDGDPEGLLAADALLKRYPETARLWSYDLDGYHRALSETSPVLTEVRLKKLQNIAHPQLQRLAAALEEEKRAAYQEALLPQLLADLLVLVQGDGSTEPRRQENDSLEPSP